MLWHVMFGCFDSMMFEFILVVYYGRICLYHMSYRCYGKMWWRHMIVGGMSHAIGFVFMCVA